jgi:DnaJ homolog subfamily A member 2
LLIEKEITLLQALTGVDFVITHLDGTKLRIQNTPGEVIKPEDIKTIADKGLPFHKQTYKNGNLFVVFKVSFPTMLAKPQIEAASIALAGMKKDDENMDDAEVVKLTKFTEGQRNTHATGGQEANESDEEEDPRGGNGQRVQCAQQ